MSFQQLNKRHTQIVQDIRDKLNRYFPQKYILSPTSSLLNSSNIDVPSEYLKPLKGHVSITQIKCNSKIQRVNSAKQLVLENQQELVGSNIRSQVIVKGRKKSQQLDQMNQKLLGQLDSLKKRMGMLEKSNSCGNLLSSKQTNNANKIEVKQLIAPKKLITEEGKPVLKKKGKIAISSKIKPK